MADTTTQGSGFWDNFTHDVGAVATSVSEFFTNQTNAKMQEDATNAQVAVATAPVQAASITQQTMLYGVFALAVAGLIIFALNKKK